ncbi:MAG TPA: helix-turn-helix domain-containing protein [Xanthomonadales bacterium]|nr:helix-turn-helix domain-containing protein [Xanthomonadales bacterium]
MIGTNQAPRAAAPELAWVSAPGDTVRDIAAERGWTRRQLAEHLGLSARHLELLLVGRLPVTEAIAGRLHDALGAPTQFWLDREDQFRERQAVRDRDPGGIAFLRVEFAEAIAEGDEALSNDLLALIFSKCASTAMELVARHGVLIAGERRLLVPPGEKSTSFSADRREQQLDRQHG